MNMNLNVDTSFDITISFTLNANISMSANIEVSISSTSILDVNANIRICSISTSTCTCNLINIGTHTCINANIGTNIRSTLVLVDLSLLVYEYSINSDIIINIRSCTTMHVVRYTAQKMKSPCPRMDLVIWMRRRARGVAKSCKNQFCPVDISRDLIFCL